MAKVPVPGGLSDECAPSSCDESILLLCGRAELPLPCDKWLLSVESTFYTLNYELCLRLEEILLFVFDIFETFEPFDRAELLADI